jgi:glyoxylase-like metal-dependent hydrolase (beta-lactamase superfamily II)
MPIQRRTFLKQATLASLTFAAALTARRAVADPDSAPDSKAPAAAPTDPDIHSFTLGGAPAHIILDGAIPLPSIQPAFAPEATKAQVEELQARNFLPTDRLTIGMNVFLLKRKTGYALFDSGAGAAFGPVGGKLLRGLARLGLTPADIKTIFVTHAHADHIGGLVDASNTPLFPAAKIIAAKREIEFWNSDTADLSGMRTPAEDNAKMHTTIKGFLAAVKPNLELHEPGKITDEVELVDAPGHTPGHAIFAVTIGGEKLLVIGDAVHIWSLQFPHPEWSMAYDTNPAQAIATRRKLFKDAAEQRTLIMAYHLPFPGLGHARPAAPGYDWVPKPWVA